ncbi:catalase family protein [Paraburkholderia sediminicola]|uniref:catalase family protein n=1 Tax=Paraburkholderia sediminicola TaxID=458836 RepID=UPI0038B9D63B
MSNYLKYADSVDVMQADEEALSDQIAESMARVGHAVFSRHCHATRNAHARSHGVLKGELVIESPLPAHLAQGLFALPGRYPVVIRLSSSPGEIGPDSQPAARGFAIKVLGVAGNKVLPDDSGHTQDFLLVNSPSIAFGDVRSYQRMQDFLERAEHDPDGMAGAAAKLKRTPDPKLETMLREVLRANSNHILGETFYSMAAVRFGEYVAKISAAPASDEVRALTGTPVGTHQRPSAFRDLVVDFFRQHGAEYHLRAQLCTDLTRMPIEDAAVVWDERVSAHQTIARIVIPRQEAYSTARRAYGDEVLSFNPWHAIEAHRPLGSIMRIRRKVYEQSSRFRHTMNGEPRREPEDISELPD